MDHPCSADRRPPESGPWRSVLKAAGGIVILLVILGGSAPASGYAQTDAESTVRRAGATVNLFQTLDPSAPTDAFRVTVPDGWTVEEVHLLRYGTVPVSLSTRTESAGHVLVRGRSSVRGPHELVVRVRLPDQAGTGHWSVQPLVLTRASPDPAERAFRTDGEQRRQVVAVEQEPVAEGPNEVLSLADAATPVRLRPEGLPPMGREHSFTVECWLQTNGLDEVVLSTWNGDNATAYPAEFVVDRGGRLRFYSGTGETYQALRSGQPVADGAWHHVAAVYDAEAGTLRLVVDGRVVDTLSGHAASPSRRSELAVGGRVGADSSTQAGTTPLFSGRLDEIRVWGKARTVEVLQRMKSRFVQEDASSEQVVRVGFDADENSVIQMWPSGARRVPATLSFQSRLRHLRASSRERTVTLRWVAGHTSVDTFVVERSADGTTFTEVATLTPSQARHASRRAATEYTYTDEDVEGQVVYYQIRQRRADGRTQTSGMIKMGLGSSDSSKAPVELIGNFPNPFAATTTVAYEVRKVQPITITVWDVTGKQIAEVARGRRQPGYHETAFDAEGLPSGTYFLRLQANDRTQSHRMVVLK